MKSLREGGIAWARTCAHEAGGFRVIKSLMIGWMIRALRRDRVAQPRGWREGGEGPLRILESSQMYEVPPGRVALRVLKPLTDRHPR